MESLLTKTLSTQNEDRTAAETSAQLAPLQVAARNQTQQRTSVIAAQSGSGQDSSTQGFSFLTMPINQTAYFPANPELNGFPTMQGVSQPQRRAPHQLPPKGEAFTLVKNYFQYPNTGFPLFHPVKFVHRFREQYDVPGTVGTAWWAALNVVMALSLRKSPKSLTEVEGQEEKANKFLQNALAVVTELVTIEANTLVLQSLLGMALLLMGTPNIRPASVILASAVRVLYHLGMHRKTYSDHLDAIDSTQHQRIFWITYILDIDFSSRLGQPPMINDDDFDVELPAIHPDDGQGDIYTVGSFLKMNLFRHRAQLAIIQNKAYRDLYSTNALKKTETEQLACVRELHQLLESWKWEMDPSFWPENIATSVPKESIVHLIITHVTYFNTMAMVHRVSIQNGEWRKSIVDFDMDHPRVSQFCMSANECMDAAKASIELINLAPQWDQHFAW
jgi:Fungal specific transcription factor domain